ncbi:MAG: ATP-binding cassette domain-containing protein [Actinobacteria bacterium]|nr:ATP-binding cassette domain-containing protein [Actinomycetota bacterium]
MVEVERVRKRFGSNVVLDGIDLTVDRGEVLVIAGPSGSGKSTLLRCVNGLEPIDEGEIRFEGRRVAAGDKGIHRVRADIGMVFQSFNLFPHRSVLDNITLGPIEVRGVAREGMTMLVVTHEMGFAREVGDRLVFIDGGKIVEDAPPAEFFGGARSERAREFVDKIIHH